MSETNYELFEYNPCIRKGKHKPKFKKQKKYLAKIQKINLIRPKRAKIINNNYDSHIFSQYQVNKIINILQKAIWEEWDSNYEFIYNLYKLSEDTELANNYNTIQEKLYEYNYDEEDYYDDYNEWCRYDWIDRW